MTDDTEALHQELAKFLYEIERTVRPYRTTLMFSWRGAFRVWLAPCLRFKCHLCPVTLHDT